MSNYYRNEERRMGIVVLAAIIIVLAVILTACSVVTIPTGKTGIITTFGRVENMTLEAGFHFKAPWQKVVKMDNREQRIEYTYSAFSSDIQQVDVIGSINYSINTSTAMQLYKSIGKGYAEVLIQPRLVENVKTVFSRYTAEELVANRDVLSGEIEDLMRADTEAAGINVVSVAIEDVDFTDAFTQAIEAKQVATQNKLKAETEQEQQTIEARAAAERQQIAADAEAEVKKINAEAEAQVIRTKADAEAYQIAIKAEAEAEANRKLSESLTDELLKRQMYESWNGELPKISGGDSAAMIIDTAGLMN